MNIKNQRGLTLLMLVITIVVLLIIATIMINFAVGDESLLRTTQKVKIEEELRAIKSRVDSEIKAKQEIEGKTEGVTLTREEQKEILGKYFDERKLVVDKNGVLCRQQDDNWKEYMDILEKIRNTTNKRNKLCRGNKI